MKMTYGLSEYMEGDPAGIVTSYYIHQIKPFHVKPFEYYYGKRVKITKPLHQASYLHIMPRQNLAGGLGPRAISCTGNLSRVEQEQM